MSDSTKHKLIAIVGPTASGKTKLGVFLAQKFNGEVVNADSMLFYKKMNVGVAKPSESDMQGVPHHLVSFLDITESFSVNRFCKEAREAIEKISEAGRLPLIVGGSGQYIWSLLEGWHIPEVSPNEQLRNELSREANEKGSSALFARLKVADPEQAAMIDGRNVRRVVRALERLEAGVVGNHRRRSEVAPYTFLTIGLRVERAVLHRRVRERVNQMIRCGWLDEVRQIMNQERFSYETQSMKAIGYREIASHLQGLITIEETTERICQSTHRLIRSQCSWFRESDARIHWVDDHASAYGVVSAWAEANI